MPWNVPDTVSTLLQISDTHFGTEQAPVVEALLRLVHAVAPELIVLSGDITQRATRAQFSAARAFCDRLGPAALLAIPGNHDLPLFNVFRRFAAPYANHRRAFGNELEPQYRSPRWLVLGVKTTRRWRHKDGVLSPAQVERVAHQLGQADAAQQRVVVVHQPVAVPTPVDAANLLHGHEAAVRRWAEAGADLVLGGHIHLPYVLPLHEVHAGLARRLWCVQAGTAVSSRLRREAGNSVNLLHRRAGAPRQAQVERWDYLPAAGRFEAVALHTLDLDRVPSAA